MGQHTPVKRESDFTRRRFAFELLHTDGPANNMPAFHWHEFMELSFVRSGHGTYEIEGRSFPVAKGDIVVINNIERHRVTYEPGDPLFETVMHFSPQLLAPREDDGLDASYLGLFVHEGRQEPSFSNKPALPEAARRSVARLVAAISGEYKRRLPWYELMIKSQLLTLVALLLRESGRPPPPSAQQMAQRRSNIARLEAVVAFLRENFASELRLSEVAGRFSMSASYFSDYFRKHLGIRFSDYLLQVRIREALKLLCDEQRKVIDVAFACGFSSAASFYRAFRKVTGTSPRDHESGAVPAEASPTSSS